MSKKKTKKSFKETFLEMSEIVTPRKIFAIQHKMAFYAGSILVDDGRNSVKMHCLEHT